MKKSELEFSTFHRRGGFELTSLSNFLVKLHEGKTASMVAEVGNVGLESSPRVSEREKYPNQRLHAKRAAILARKRSTSSTKETVPQNMKQENSEKIPHLGAKAKEKKAKKYVPAPWLCENMSVVPVASVRSDVDDALAVLSGTKQPEFYSEYNKWELDFDELDLELMCHKKRTGKALAPKLKALASLNYITKRKLEDVIRIVGKRAVIKSDVMSRLKANDENINYVKERRNHNTELMLDLKDLRRKSELQPQPAKKVVEKPSPKPNYVRQKKVKCNRATRRKRRWTSEERERRNHVPHEFELHVENVERDDPEETDLMCFLLDLQNREMTPEDYEMLLRLDDKVAPKTVDNDRLTTLRTETISDAEIEKSPDGIPWVDAVCSVCMDTYENGQVVKFLPCNHVFHGQCIEMWLNNSGNTCPLDGLEV